MTFSTPRPEGKGMPIVKININRQVTIPKRIFDEMGLKEGDFVEVTRNKNTVVVKPKKLVNLEAVLTAEEEKVVAKGFGQIQKGEYETLDQLKHELDG